MKTTRQWDTIYFSLVRKGLSPCHLIIFLACFQRVLRKFAHSNMYHHTKVGKTVRG